MIYANPFYTGNHFEIRLDPIKTLIVIFALMFRHLNKQYFKYNSKQKPWTNGVSYALVILLLFLLFQPFGFRDKELWLKSLLFPGYAFFAFFYSYFGFFLVKQILKKKKTWTLKNELIYFILSIPLLTIFIHIFTYFVAGDMPFTFYWYFKLLFHVSSLFLIIAITEFLYYNNKSASIKNEQLFSQVLNVSEQLNRIKKEKGSDTVSINLEKGAMDFNRNKIAFIQSIGNYLEFYLLEQDERIKKISKRGRLHQAEKDLTAFPEFFKCHRAFIVNLRQVHHIKGNAKNAKIVFEKGLDEIPVSRSFYMNLKEQIEQLAIS